MRTMAHSESSRPIILVLASKLCPVCGRTAPRGYPPRPGLGLELGSTDMVGNMDMSCADGTDEIYEDQSAKPADQRWWYHYAVRFVKPFPANQRIRVFVAPANVEAAYFRTYVSNDQSGSETTEFILSISNQSGANWGNPNWDYLVVTHPLP